MTATQRYNLVAIALHWILAILMIFMVFFGEDLMEFEEEEVAASVFLPSLHVSIGVAILLLSVLRLLWRLLNPPPLLPATMKSWEVALSHATHFAFYILMIGVPLLGWLAVPGLIADEPGLAGISAFGIGLPHAPDIGLDAKELHEIGSNAAMILIVLHVLAALKHQFIDRDGLLWRMSPH